MPKIILALIFIINFFKQAQANRVVPVNDTSYEEHITNNDYVAIYFHAVWSNDSKTLRMQFLALPHSVNIDQKIAFLETTSKAYMMNYKYDIKRYPSIILVNKDKNFLFNGQMKTRDMADWIESKISKKIAELSDLSEVEKIFEKADSFVLFIGDVDEKYNSYQEFLQATENFGEAIFMKLSNQTLIDMLNIIQEYKNLSPKILIFKTFDDNLNVFSPKNSAKFNAKNIVNFIRGFSQPAINAFSSNNHIYVVNNKIEFAILVVNSNKTIDFNDDIYAPEGLQLYKDFYTEAMKYRGKVFFMLANFTDLSQTTIPQDFEFNEKDLPIVIINGYNPEKTRNERFKSSSDDLDNLTEFYEKYKYKALPRFLKSEDLPNKVFVHPNVYKLVRKNFFNLVVDSDNHFLVYLIRRNCGLCNEVYYLCLFV